jgi:hypothetical protein
MTHPTQVLAIGYLELPVLVGTRWGEFAMSFYGMSGRRP